MKLVITKMMNVLNVITKSNVEGDLYIHEETTHWFKWLSELDTKDYYDFYGFNEDRH